MRLSPLRRTRDKHAPAITGVARLDRRTKNLIKRLRPGDIAVIHHIDLDRVSAEALVGCRVAAVINAAESVSGRYPNLGPEVIVAAGIPLIDAAGTDVFTALHDGDRVRIDGGRISRGENLVAQGIVLDSARIEELMEQARSGLSAQLEAFTLNTVEFLRRERDLLLDGVGVPEVATRLDGRHVLYVLRGYDYRQDLRGLRSYIREYRPVLIGVDGGADALVEAGYTPDMVIGDLDAVSDGTLRRSGEIVVHASRDARAPGLERLERLGLDAVVFPAGGTSEDAAMLLADTAGASLIVAVGSHASLVEFLDQGRSGMASTFLTRLRVGPKLVDAKGVSRLYHSQIRTWQLLLLLLAGLLAVLVAVSATPSGEHWLNALDARWDNLLDFFRDLLCVIDFRYHVISIVAIFLALATGIALGAGPLQDPLTEGLASQAQQDRLDKEELRSELLQTQDRVAFGDSYAADTSEVVLGSSLAGRTVSLVPLPGSDPGDVRALREEVAAANGTVVSTVTVDEGLLDPANRQLAEGLAQQVLDGVNSSAPEGAASYDLVGAAIARAFLTRGERPLTQDNDASSIEAALAEAEFVSVDGEVDRRAQLALVVGGDPNADAPEGLYEVAAELASALDTGSMGVVVAGTPASAVGGVVQAVRESEVGDDVSSVDAVNLAAGRVVTMLAAAEQFRGGVGHYGQVDAEDGAVPERAPPPPNG